MSSRYGRLLDPGDGPVTILQRAAELDPLLTVELGADDDCVVRFDTGREGYVEVNTEFFDMLSPYRGGSNAPRRRIDKKPVTFRIRFSGPQYNPEMTSLQVPNLTGTLYHLPFQSSRIGTETESLFLDLTEEYGIENVLVLKRFPAGIEAIEHAYADAIDGVERPSIVALSTHATRVVSDLTDPRELVDPGERQLLLETYLRKRAWSDPYLQRAASHKSFTTDVGRFVTEATWQGGRIDTDDPTLQELAEVYANFHDWLAGANLLDRNRSMEYAAEALADPDQRSVIQAEFDAVLALEFEEFTAIDREYLARLTRDTPLYCVAQADSAIQRTWNEPRQITNYAPELERATLPDGETPGTPSAPGIITTYLATGNAHANPESAPGSVHVIESDTFSDEIAAIAEEIERLHRTEEIPYEEMAVVLRDANAPIPETLRGLRAAGVPVASATVGGLEHDPAARELYALVSWCFRATDPNPPATGETDALPGWTSERARSVLEARVDATPDQPTAIDDVLTAVRDRADRHGLTDAVNYWLLATDLKHRIAIADDTLDAKTQFGHVRTLRRLIRAVDESELLDSSWRTLCLGFERELQRASTDKITTGLELPNEGVLVDAIRVLKHERRSTVFVVDAIDREFPAAPQFTSLFPTPQLEQLDGYPAFTTPTAEDVTETFGPAADDEPTRPLHAYYAALSRRLLAVGARCAGDRLYFGLHREDASGTGRHHQPSRFLSALEDTFGAFDRVDHEGIHSHGEAVRFALTRVDEALDRVRRAGLVTEPIDLGAVEAEFEAVQRILDADPPADLAPAIEARLDFAEGGVRRD